MYVYFNFVKLVHRLYTYKILLHELINYIYFKNSLIIHEEKTKDITGVFIYINFSFDFLGL
jgi:hypothetical protein